MSNETQLVSKALVLDKPEHFDKIKQFCDENGLVCLKFNSKNVMTVLRSNIDLGAILLAENYYESIAETIELAHKINVERPELPIILRITTTSNFDNLPEKQKKLFCATYNIDDISPLQKVLDDYIFSMVYPNALVRGISEFTINTLKNLNVLLKKHNNFKIITETPYIVRDRIIFGEVCSLIPLESSWCRGYMMLQTQEDSILTFLGQNELKEDEEPISFRTVNNILGELTNLLWGAFKTHFISFDDTGPSFPSEVPLVINHQHKYISFGSTNPHLCFKYTLVDESKNLSIPIYQWFVFNLYWSPENFKEIKASVDDFMDSGELELF